MKSHRTVLTLIAANVALLLLVGAQSRSTSTEKGAATLRAQALELVDSDGQVRAQLNVEPGGDVVFRLRDDKGTIRVKLAAGKNGSGMLLLDETTEPAVHMIARRTASTEWPTSTSITLRGDASQERVLKPVPE